LEVDAGAVFTNEGDSFKLQAALQLPKDFERDITDDRFTKALEDLTIRGEPLVINDTGNGGNFLSAYQLSIDFSKKYGSIFVYPSRRRFVSQIVFSFSKQRYYFTENKITACVKTFEKSLFTLSRLNEHVNCPYDDIQNEQEKLLTYVCALLARLFRAEKCIIALFENEMAMVKGSFGEKFPLILYWIAAMKLFIKSRYITPSISLKKIHQTG